MTTPTFRSWEVVKAVVQRGAGRVTEASWRTVDPSLGYFVCKLDGALRSLMIEEPWAALRKSMGQQAQPLTEAEAIADVCKQLGLK